MPCMSVSMPLLESVFDVCHGGNLGGIFTAACLAEALHALKNGVFSHSLRNVLGGQPETPNHFQNQFCMSIVDKTSMPKTDEVNQFTNYSTAAV